LSKAHISATSLLCRLLEQDRPEIDGAAFLDTDFILSGRELIHERLLAVGPAPTHVSCPDCGIELARIVRAQKNNQVLLYCDECEEVSASEEITKSYTINLKKFIKRLAFSLDFDSTSYTEIDADVSWRLGVQEFKHRKAQTWYFARHLFKPSVALKLLKQINADRASHSAKILTSSKVPLPDGSPLASFNVVNLSAAARLTQSRFLFFDHRMDSGVSPTADETPPHTTLRFVRDKSLAYVGGVKYPLEGMQQNILLSLIDSRTHQLELYDLAEKSGSDAKDFKTSKNFGRNMTVYKTFIKYDRSDLLYKLIIHPEDQGWINSPS